jgi:sialate O-acetylesterase
MYRVRIVCLAIAAIAASSAVVEAKPLKLHNIFSSHMVLQRDKPIKIWGWADAGDEVSVKLGDEQAQATAGDDAGRWEVTFPAREASTEPVTLVASTGDEKVEMKDILIGDVWVMYGQSNMAIPLGDIKHGRLEAQQAHSSKLRLFSIKENEQRGPQDNIEADAITTGGWVVSNPETARDFSAIGYVFGARIQRASQIPVGLIKNSRGGAAMESLVPQHKFDDHPKAKRYAKHIEKKIAEFDARAEALRRWKRRLKRAKSNDKPESEWPEKPDHAENLRSWDIPGKSPSDRASVYNGMFGAFKGYNLKGVLFHHGYNNAMVKERCRPKFYRVLMKLMIDGVREDFNDPDLPFGVIGFCAAGRPQNRTNFEANAYKYTGGAAFIREAQRLALTDISEPENTEFIPAYDVQDPSYHPSKKRELGGRAARWALSEIYGKRMRWQTAKLVSVERRGDEMVLTFDQRVRPDDKDSILRGFSIAGEDGQFYMARARHKAEGSVWDRTKIVHVWSPLVDKPVAVRYGWAVAPMGNLKVNDHPHLPLHSFRTDDWDYPESEDPTESAVTGSKMKEMQEEAAERLEYRRTEEAKRALEIMERLKTLGHDDQ